MSQQCKLTDSNCMHFCLNSHDTYNLAFRFNDVPRWSGLNHFHEVMNMTFTDGMKFKDISKVHINISTVYCHIHVALAPHLCCIQPCTAG